MNPLKELPRYGQSLWLDYIRRSLITSGELQRLIDEDGLRGVTSNPSIFDKAIAGSHDYDEAIRALARQGKATPDIYQSLAVEDIRRAADLFRPVYDRLEGADGFISLEVSPHLARDTEGTVAEARNLWGAVDRPNVLIKVPGTREGLPAIRRLIGEGINVNVTLLFGLPRYREVAEAYLAGLEERAAAGRPVERVASVASFFLSRIDVLLDPRLEQIAGQGGEKAKLAASLVGEAATASAKAAYQIYKEIFGGERFRKLAAGGARPQRLLWASTSTKNPAYSDVKYVEPLIGPQTVNTAPPETIDAYRDHGRPASRLEEDVDQARRVLEELAAVGIDIDRVTRQLEDEGVEKFVKPFDQLLSSLEEKRRAALADGAPAQELHLGSYEAAVGQRLQELARERFGARLWDKDAALWKSDPAARQVIGDALGWLHVAEAMTAQVNSLSDFRSELRAAGFTHVVHMGMGGSSLAPLVFQRSLEREKDALELNVLDTTDPATILRIERRVPAEKTLFIVASKSGTTAEPLAFGEYFYDRLRARKGSRAGENFAVITDPGTPLAQQAKERGYRRTFLNFRDIGGRYSALSYFGLVPAALMGADVSRLLSGALRMQQACAAEVPTPENPGVVLGAVMGELARQGRDKVTLLLPKPVDALGMWLEQLLAESTGKERTGLLPVAGEPPGDPSVYGADRLFVSIRLRGAADRDLDDRVEALRAAGHPVVALQMEQVYDLAREFFRWEIATATAGAVLGINAFDQPNVQESKDNTNRLLKEVREKGSLPAETLTATEGPLSFDAPQAAPTAAGTLARFLSQARPGDYAALMAYLPEEPETGRALQSIRLHLRDRLRLATTLGYGPRFLHSTGQLHKGGPPTGLFLQVTADDAEDAPLPGQPYSFGVFKRAQALGDLEALRRHGRRALRVHLGRDLRRGLAALEEALRAALSESRP